MCGIFGLLDKYIDRELALKCIDSMTHRGPDGGGIWQDKDVTLGHRRLAIIDLSDGGHQPMSYADGRYQLVFNGEIYNYIELREELESLGHSFRSDSDSEVVIASFLEWGEECQLKFNGMWAFAIYDTQSGRLFLSRDRFGVKPLYYIFLEDGGFAFASEMKALLPLIKNPQANKELFDYFSHVSMHYENTVDCLIKGVKRFPAGSCAEVCKGNVKAAGAVLSTKKWWNTLDHLVDVPDRYEEQVELFREIFLDSCKLRMRSDVTLGTALSGGLDSSATICAMAKIAKDTNVKQDWQHAFVATFPGSWIDESEYAKKVTDSIGINSTFLEINPEITEEKLINSVYLFEELWNNPQIPMMEIYRQERKEGSLVSLDGHAADELFAGYEFDVLKAIPDAFFSRNVRSDEMLQGKSSFARMDDITACAWDMYEDEYREQLGSYSSYARKQQCESISKYAIKGLLHKPQVKSEYANHPRWKELSNLDKTLFVSTHETILPTLLRNYDRDSMANGVEIRMPFMDYRIATLAFSIGWSSKVRDGYSKAIVRDAVESFVPSEVVRRKHKVGFNAPLDEWMRGKYRDLFGDLINSAGFASCNLVEDAARTRKEFDSFVKQDGYAFANATELWKQLQPYLWEKAML